MLNKSNSTNHKILVIGDIMIDHYLWGKSDRISPEAPVPVVEIKKESSVLGGAGNVLNNLKSLGADVDVISVIGDDIISKELKTLLRSNNINTNFIISEKNRVTTKKCRIVASDQQVVRYDIETIRNITSTTQSKILKIYNEIIKSYKIIILSDYGKGVLVNSLTKKLIEIANYYDIKVLVDPKGSDYSKYAGAYLLTPNKKEAFEATKIKIDNEVSLKKALLKLKNKYDLSISLITLSEKGIAYFDKDLKISPAVAKEIYDVTGAGDTVIATIAFYLASNSDIDQAVYFSNLAAGIVVGKIGSSTTTIQEINEFENKIQKKSYQKKIISKSELIQLRQTLNSKKIVFTNGCFDILHIGHVKYLEKAKSYGDKLIVAINNDNSVKKLKGSSRPINNENDRSYIIASLSFVDYVIIFEEETPYEIIEMCKPNILIKGGDYKGKNIIGQDLVDEVIIVDYIEGKSTTGIIKKIECTQN